MPTIFTGHSVWDQWCPAAESFHTAVHKFAQMWAGGLHLLHMQLEQVGWESDWLVGVASKQWDMLILVDRFSPCMSYATDNYVSLSQAVYTPVQNIQSLLELHIDG